MNLYYHFLIKLFIYIKQKNLIIFADNMDKSTLELLHAQLDTHRQLWGSSWNKLVAQAKVSSTLWAEMEQGLEPSAEDLAKLRTWLNDWGDRWS